jgi:L-glyceraldehyde 3-phosphate reductase
MLPQSAQLEQATVALEVARAQAALTEEGADQAQISAALNQIAQARGQSMAQLAVAWVLRHPVVTSALIGASRVSQIEELVATLNNVTLSPAELADIERILAE